MIFLERSSAVMSYISQNLAPSNIDVTISMVTHLTPVGHHSK